MTARGRVAVHGEDAVAAGYGRRKAGLGLRRGKRGGTGGLRGEDDLRDEHRSEQHHEREISDAKAEGRRGFEF